MTASGNTLKKEYVNPITHGVIWKQLLLYFVPLLLSSFLQLCYNTADTIIVGRFVGKIALTAVGGSAGQIYAMVTEFMIGASGGAAVIMSQAYGARNKKLLDDGLHNAVALALAMGALFTVTGLLVSRAALVTAGAPAETMAGSLMYLRTAFAGLIPCALYNMGASVLRAVGDSKRPLRFLVIGIGLNIALDILFVAVLHLGIGGAALATVMTQTLSAALVLRALMKGAGKTERANGALDSLRPAMITFLGTCVLRILWVLFVFPRFPSMRVLLFCFPVSWSVTAVIYAVYYSWYRKNIICLPGGSS